MQSLPMPCAECLRIAKALRGAWRADAQKLRAKVRDAAVSSGRDPREFGIGWVFSVARMPDEEMRALLEAHYPTVAETTRRREEHEKLTGHSLKAWSMFSSYSADEAD